MYKTPTSKQELLDAQANGLKIEYSCGGEWTPSIKNNTFKWPLEYWRIETAKPHKHAEVIKAWADGAEIEVRDKGAAKWQRCFHPNWSDWCEYRVKPEPKPDTGVIEPYFVEFGRVWHGSSSDKSKPYGKLKYTLDGETGKLKAVELI